ncbi:hypothetical protein [Thalassoporum mexicanum]|nr:hypothetical protein [Pseudanabaena sp. PCC 7367]
MQTCLNVNAIVINLAQCRFVFYILILPSLPGAIAKNVLFSWLLA